MTVHLCDELRQFVGCIKTGIGINRLDQFAVSQICVFPSLFQTAQDARGVFVIALLQQFFDGLVFFLQP